MKLKLIKSKIKINHENSLHISGLSSFMGAWYCPEEPCSFGQYPSPTLSLIELSTEYPRTSQCLLPRCYLLTGSSKQVRHTFCHDHHYYSSDELRSSCFLPNWTGSLYLFLGSSVDEVGPRNLCLQEFHPCGSYLPSHLKVPFLHPSPSPIFHTLFTVV